MGGIAWTREEDLLLINCIKQYGEGKWHRVPQLSGLKRCRKSCRLRWLNYLRPNIKRGKFSEDEVDLILKLHRLLGNRWSLIAGRLPGRTSNDIKNYWNHHLCKKMNIPTNSLIESKVEVIKPQARTFEASSSFQHLLGFELAPMPILYGDGAQEPMMTLHDHDRDRYDDDKDEEEDACFEECGKIYRQLFHDLHEFED